MISIVLAALATLVGILIYYVRAISVLVDEKERIEKSKEDYERYLWLYRISEKMEKYWPTVRDATPERWSKIISNISLLIVLSLLVTAGIFKEFVGSNAGYILISILILGSLSNGHEGLQRYRRIKPYLPVIFPAVIYHSLTMMEFHGKEIMDLLTLPGYEYAETKMAITFVAFLLAFKLPYSMAKFDDWFSRFISKTTLNFVKDFMRLSVKPENEVEAAVRKTAKETIAVTLKIILAIVGVLNYLSAMS